MRTERVPESLPEHVVVTLSEVPRTTAVTSNSVSVKPKPTRCVQTS
jgi:hypothetical protein